MSRARDVVWHILRVGAALCFIGHGAFGIITKQAWVPYFGLVGIPPDLAFALMPVVGTIDILLGVAAVVYPARFVFAYMLVWAVWTAALRPLAGEPVWELLERAGNYGVPLALLFMTGFPAVWRDWFSRLRTADLRPGLPRSVLVALQVSVVLLVLGHAGYGLGGRELLSDHYAVLGLGAPTVLVIGGFELGLATALATTLSPALLVLTAIWKLGTELLYPLAGQPIWEFIERSGSYAAPIALAGALLGARYAESGEWVSRAFSARAGWAALLLMLTIGVAAGVTGLATAPALEAAPSVRTAPGPEPGARISATLPGQPLQVLPAAADTVWKRLSGAALLRELEAGSTVLACRHAITDRSRGDQRRVDFSDRRTQRNLSAAGERQARDLGREIAGLDVPIGSVYTSPYARTHESADLTFGRAEISDVLYGDRDRARLRRLFSEPTGSRGNRVLMTHQYILRRMLRVFRPGEIEEGDCVVVRPRGAGRYDIAAHLSPGEWRGLR